MRYRTRFVDVNALQYDGSIDSVVLLRELLPKAAIEGPAGPGDQLLLDGRLHSKGDWIVKNGNGHYRVLTEEEFPLEYAPW